MDFLINESQLRVILQEQDQSKMSDYMKELYSFTSNLVNRAKKTYGLNLKLLLTWGASVGGLVMPLDNFIRTGRFDLTDEQATLILIGVACTYFYDNVKSLKTILTKIKEEGLEDTFKEVLIKSRNLKDSFLKFLKSANVTLGSTLELITYSFLIPIITDIQSAITEGSDIQTTSMRIAQRLIASGVIVVGKIALTETIKKIIKKFE
jgi:hypothetical protein